MALNSVCVGNFKGIESPIEIEIKPITLFIGPNSSGKSSVIHALAALAQTVNLPNNTRPLVLDDEFAYVHLGRFIEIIHSKHYEDAIMLGISGGEASVATITEGNPVSHSVVNTSAQYTFKSTRRTQDIFLDSAIIKAGDINYSANKSKSGYSITSNINNRVLRARLANGFSFDRLTFGATRRSFYEYQPLISAQRALEMELHKTLYLGPFRQPPARRYPTRGSSPREVGPRGEATVTLLANEMVQTKNRKHMKQVSEWFEVMGLAKKLGVSRLGGSDLFDVNITLRDGEEFPLADLGYGFSQILPVLTQLSFAPDGGTLLFEQPELHLHTLAVRPLAKVFIDAVEKSSVHIVAETHSQELFLEFINEMRAGRLSPENFVAYKVNRSKGSSKITPIEIDPDDFDVYEMWETGFTKS